MAYPRKLRATEISPEITHLVRELAIRLLAGSTAVHAALREQLAMASVSRVTLTGAGLFADLAVPETAARVAPSEIIGGEVLIEVEGLDAPAGSLIKVKDGHLAFVEVYTYGNL